MNTQNTQDKEFSSQNKIKIRDVEINSKVISAPMAGITDFVLRKLIRKYSKDCLLTTEMISSEALVQQQEVHIVHTDEEEQPIAFQISGHKPPLVAKSADILKNRATIIDINMGCPVNKVMKATDGCALMKSPEVAASLVRAVKETVGLPVTCKFRLGINQTSINFVEFAVKMPGDGEKPVLLLDDVLSELDETRRRKLVDAVKKMQTIFIPAGSKAGGSIGSIFRCSRRRFGGLPHENVCPCGFRLPYW